MRAVVKSAPVPGPAGTPVAQCIPVKRERLEIESRPMSAEEWETAKALKERLKAERDNLYALALRNHPRLNAAWDEDRIIHRSAINLGVAFFGSLLFGYATAVIAGAVGGLVASSGGISCHNPITGPSLTRTTLMFPVVPMISLLPLPARLNSYEVMLSAPYCSAAFASPLGSRPTRSTPAVPTPWTRRAVCPESRGFPFPSIPSRRA